MMTLLQLINLNIDIGNLIYLMVTRPNIVHVIGIVRRFQANPKETHIKAVKRIFKYLQGTQDIGLWYPKNTYFDLHG